MRRYHGLMGREGKGHLGPAVDQHPSLGQATSFILVFKIDMFFLPYFYFETYIIDNSVMKR
jgi:hypothetical protein